MMNFLFKTFSVITLFFLFISSSVFSQSKKPLDHSVYDDWKSVDKPVISNSGEYVSYEINPQKGDGALTLYDANKKSYENFSRGVKPVFGSNSNFLVYTIKPQYDTVRKLKLEKVKKDKMPKDSLGIYVFGTRSNFKFQDLKSVGIPEKESDWIVGLFEMQEKVKPEKDTTEKKADEKKPDEKKKKKSKKKKDKDLFELIIFNPISLDTFRVEKVKKFAFSNNGLNCVYVQMTNDSIDSVHVAVFNTKKIESRMLYQAPGYFSKLGIDEQGSQFAFSYSADTAKVKTYSLMFGSLKNDKVEIIASPDIEGIEEGWTASEHADLFFNKSGSELYFGTAAAPEPELKDTLTADEKVSLDIWNWKDPLLQPHQHKQLKKEQKRNYTAVYFPKDKKAIQLGSEELKTVSIDTKTDGELSLAYDNNAYRKLLSWDGSRYKDVYLVNRTNGDKKRILAKVAATVSISPDQNFVGWYSIADSSWNIYKVKEKTTTCVSAGLGVNFYNELNDMPNEARQYGMAGWTKDEKLLIYDRYDIWQIDPSGKEKPTNLTQGKGRENNMRMRYKKLDYDEKYLLDNMLLSVFNEENKKAGYYNFDSKKGELTELIYGDFNYRKIIKAKGNDQVIWTKESFTLFPDLYLSDLDFASPAKLSDANPQQSEYNWGTTELVSWHTFNGDTSVGLLVKPEDFDPNKKYPMLVYFYETSSNRLNVYYTPKPIRSVINWTYYASNGYLIFIPDIKYKTGYPGPSAYDYIVSGTQAMCEQYDFIDRENLGIQGQSWGGYQTAYIVTQTDMYKAAMAGAPVSNMTSAYGGIRWGSGLSRAFQYEETQSRIGATLWERRDLYILNSPLFFADQINTPLLMMHNDDDGAVPWYQGIEFFNALRRLDKPTWMLVYNKAPHNLKRRADMEDLTIRMQQFFDYFLKGEPEPVWMKSGIPAIDKGKSFGFELD